MRGRIDTSCQHESSMTESLLGLHGFPVEFHLLMYSYHRRSTSITYRLPTTILPDYKNNVSRVWVPSPFRRLHLSPPKLNWGPFALLHVCRQTRGEVRSVIGIPSGTSSACRARSTREH